MSGLLSNAISGLQASQVALRTAGNNISNANVAGYSRQVANFSTRSEQQLGGAGYLGNGVNADAVTRVVNEFVNTQLRLDIATYNELDKYNTSISSIDKLLSDSNTGLAGGLQSFFSALQGSVSDPSSTPARQLVLTQAQSLASRFNTLYDRLNEASQSNTNELSSVTAQISTIAKNIADLNKKIASNDASGSGGGKPNDLLDQRDQAVRTLSELTSVQIIQEGGGDVNVFIGNGEPLVVGPNVSKLSSKSDGTVYIASSSSQHDITHELSGGKLGGLLKFQSDVLSPSMNELGRVAIVLTDIFNTAQSEGLDLGGHYGSSLFTEINDPSVIYSRVQHADNPPPQDRVLSLKISDSSKITSSNYDFSIAAGSKSYTITRMDDGTVVSQGILSGQLPEKVDFDGLTLELESGSFQGGDRFTLLPTKTASRDIHTLLTAPESLAYASPIQAGATIKNTGTGTITPGQVLGIHGTDGELLPAFQTAGSLNPPLIIRFTSETTYEVLDNTNPFHPIPLNPPMGEQVYYPNKVNQIFTTDPGETKIISAGEKLGLPAGKLALPSVFQPTAIYPNTPYPAQLNGYPVEQYTFQWKNTVTGELQAQQVVTSANASAVQTASQLSLVPGVTAHAYTTATITDINIDGNGFAYPLQISINGEKLIGYTGTTMSNAVPNPNPTPLTNPHANEVAFNNYLVDQINHNPNLQGLGIRAESGSNPVTGRPEIRMVASSGVDLDIRFTASNPSTLSGMGYTNPTQSSISVNDSSGNPSVRLIAQADATDPAEQSAITVGGHIEVTLASGISMSSQPTESSIFGDTSAPDFAQSTYKGYQVAISGRPKTGDTFTINFNKNAKNDNRNGLSMATFDSVGTIQNNSMSLSQGYSKLVEQVGTKSNLSKINTEASKSVLDQTQSMRDGVSGVNLDEEASNLIQYQQLYTANARVINIAKDLFDTLLQSIG